jgi:hypothetical protein
MKTTLSLIALLLASSAYGTTITASGTDPSWNINDSSCTAASGFNCVIGDPTVFGIKDASLTVSSSGAVSADVQLNFENSTLNPFVDFGDTLSAADMIIQAGGGEYALVLHSHSGLVAGGLYSIISTEDAQTVLGNPGGVYYRNSLAVWANASGAVELGSGTITVTALGNGTTAPEYNVAVTGITGGAGLFSPSLSFEQASATCGNGVVFGTVPEAGTLGMVGGGLVLLGILRRKYGRKV